MDLTPFFSARSVAVIGASKNPNKVGHIIFRNFLDGSFRGNVFPVNPNADYIVGQKVYPTVTAIKEQIDLAVIAVPSDLVLRTLRDCAKKKIKHLVMVTAGFEETGNTQLAEQVKDFLKKNKMAMIGPNCLGVFNAHNGVDTLFLPRSRLGRPRPGSISFICQSGAVGSAILDLAAYEGYGFAKFASYGNAMVVDESDLLQYFGDDPETDVICMYIEGVKDGRKFYETARRVAKKKPIIAIKGGLTQQGNAAALSHTGSLGGDAAIYTGVFKQVNVIHAESLEDLFNYAKVLEKAVKPRGDHVQIITNGGGYGIITTDEIVASELNMAKMSEATQKRLQKAFPPIVIVNNPMDLLGDTTSERYKIAVQHCLQDPNIDVLLVIVLMQTPLLGTDVVDTLIELNKLRKKPLLVVCTGGEFTMIMKRTLEQGGVPTFTFPLHAVRAIKSLVEYYRHRS